MSFNINKWKKFLLTEAQQSSYVLNQVDRDKQHYVDSFISALDAGPGKTGVKEAYKAFSESGIDYNILLRIVNKWISNNESMKDTIDALDDLLIDLTMGIDVLVTENQQPELLEEALEDRVPVSVAEEIREDISTFSWVMAGGVTGKKQPQDVKGVENLLADWFVQAHDPKDHVNPRRWSQYNENWAKNQVVAVIADFWEKAQGQTNPHMHPLPSGHMGSRQFPILKMLEYDKNLNISLAQASLEMQIFVTISDHEWARRESAWKRVKTFFNSDPSYPKAAWIDRPMPEAWMTIPNPTTMTRPALFRIAKGFKNYKVRSRGVFGPEMHGMDFPFDIDFKTDAPTFQTVIDYLKPIDEQFNKLTDQEEIQTYYNEANSLIMRSFGRVSGREMKLAYNYLVGKPKSALPESSLEKIKAVADDTKKYFGEQDPLSYKIMNGVHKRLKKIINRDEGVENEIKDEMLTKLQRHFLMTYKNLYVELIRRSKDVFEFLDQKATGWRELKGKSLTDAIRYCKAAINNFESEDQVRIKYPDGSYWYEIGAAGCDGDEDNEWRDKELKKAAQRHANCAADAHGSLWTLRYKDKEGLIESEIMISYFREHNRIGQIKGSLPKSVEGQGNLAPAKKWWKHILDLVNQLKVTEIRERGQYTSPDEQGKFEPFLLWIKKNAKHDVNIEFREEPPQWGPAAFPAQNPWEPDGEQPFQERLRRNLNLKPKKKLSNNAQAKLEWYKRRKRK